MTTTSAEAKARNISFEATEVGAVASDKMTPAAAVPLVPAVMIAPASATVPTASKLLRQNKNKKNKKKSGYGFWPRVLSSCSGLHNILIILVPLTTIVILF